MNVGVAIEADLARPAVHDRTEAAVRAVVEVYAAGDETVRAAVGGYSTGTRRFGGWRTYPETGTRLRSPVPVWSTSAPVTRTRTRAMRS
jgi:hypothetical protein